MTGKAAPMSAMTKETHSSKVNQVGRTKPIVRIHTAPPAAHFTPCSRRDLRLANAWADNRRMRGNSNQGSISCMAPRTS